MEATHTSTMSTIRVFFVENPGRTSLTLKSKDDPATLKAASGVVSEFVGIEGTSPDENLTVFIFGTDYDDDMKNSLMREIIVAMTKLEYVVLSYVGGQVVFHKENNMLTFAPPASQVLVYPSEDGVYRIEAYGVGNVEVDVVQQVNLQAQIDILGEELSGESEFFTITQQESRSPMSNFNWNFEYKDERDDRGVDGVASLLIEAMLRIEWLPTAQINDTYVFKRVD